MDAPIEPSAFSSLIRQRRSVRDFRPDPVPDHLLQRVLDDAAWAPSWSNTQPYVIAVASGDVRDRISARLGDLYDRAQRARAGGLPERLRILVTRNGLPDGDFDTGLDYPAELQPYRRATGFGLYGVLGIERSDKEARHRQMRRNFEFFGAPTVIFVFVHGGLKEFAVLDAGVLLQSIMLSAEANGLGTCAQGALATWGGPVRDEFDVPAGYKLVCGMAVGFASDHPVNAYNPGRRDVPRAAATDGR